ncbi:26S proteasome non-ATPase regulatory subunit 10-like, partial [Haliotis cracherodii]|uniref:26S proteasome non-ATPase regulatory subunit 10-like n=1 Tax=Haliotis cracherodii TaxID=6455 RepID=UPI0039E9AA4E
TLSKTGNFTLQTAVTLLSNAVTQKASRSDPTPNVTLLDACRAGDVDEVRNVVGQRGVSLNCRGVCRDTPVIVAAEKGHREVVKLLVNDGADVTLLNDVGNNILHVACRGSDVEMVKFLLSLNMVDINSRGWRNRTPVLEAAVNGRRDVVELLMSEGADVSMGDDDGNSTLHLACVGGYVETVKFVLSQNVVDIDARNTLGQTAAAVARSRGHQHVVDLLMSHSGQ